MQDNVIKKAVRDILAVNPLASQRTVAMLATQRTGHQISQQYVMKMMRQARGDSVREIEFQFAVHQVARMSESYRAMIESLQERFYEIDLKTGKFVMDDFNRSKTADTIAKLHRTLYVSMMDAGIFKKQNGVLEVKHSLAGDETPEDIQNMVVALRNWGIAGDPPEHVEAPIMDDATVLESKDGDTTTTTDAIPAAPKIFRSGAVDIDEELERQQKESATSGPTTPGSAVA